MVSHSSNLRTSAPAVPNRSVSSDHRPARLGCGTRTQATSDRLPKSSPAARRQNTSSLTSCLDTHPPETNPHTKGPPGKSSIKIGD